MSSSWVHDLCAGSVSGGVAVMVSHPFDTVRIQQQNVRARMGAIEGVRTLVRSEGMWGLYRGVASPLFATPVQFATTFFSFGVIRRQIEKVNENRRMSKAAESALAGGAAGGIQCLVGTPADVVKIRLQTAGLANQSIWTCIRNITFTEGPGVLYKGLMAGLVRKIPANAVFFSSYETFRGKLEPRVGNVGILLAGGLAGTASWITTYPLDVIKTRIQASPEPLSMRACLSQGIHKEGFGFLFRGLPVTLVRSFPMHAILFYTFDVVSNYLNNCDSKMMTKVMHSTSKSSFT